MAKKKSGPSKSSIIRDLLTDNPKMKAKEVVKTLAEKGVKVQEGLVYAVKGAMKARKKRKARVVRAVKAANTTGATSKTDAITLIREVKALAVKTGGYDKLKELVVALAE